MRVFSSNWSVYYFLVSFFAQQICFFLKINPKTFNGCVSDPLSQKCRSRGHFIGKPSNLLASQERKKNAQNIGKKVHSKSSVMFFCALDFSVPVLLKMTADAAFFILVFIHRGATGAPEQAKTTITRRRAAAAAAAGFYFSKSR